MVDDIFYASQPRNNKEWLNMMFGRMYADTDGVIKLKEVNKMKDWIVVHAVDGSVEIIRKDSITYVGADKAVGTLIHTNNFSYLVSENYADIVRRIIE